MSEAIKEAGAEPPLGWYVVVTKGGQEKVAYMRLLAQGYDTYLPLRLVQLKRNEVGVKPLFPRHLFVRQNGRWRAMFSTIGVRSVVCLGDNPAVLSDAAIQLFREHEIDGHIIIHPAAPKPELKPCPYEPGQRVKMKQGLLIGLEAVFSERVDANRVAILLKALGRETRVELDMGDLKHIA